MSKKRIFTTEVIQGVIKYPDNPEENLKTFAEFLEEEINKILLKYPHWEFKGITKLDLSHAHTLGVEITGEVKATVLFESKKKKKKATKIFVKERKLNPDDIYDSAELIETTVIKRKNLRFHSMIQLETDGLWEFCYLFFKKKS